MTGYEFPEEYGFKAMGGCEGQHLDMLEEREQTQKYTDKERVG